MYGLQEFDRRNPCTRYFCVFLAFFFQAEDGIRHGRVTGVQTCALPISRTRWTIHGERLVDENPHVRLSVASVELPNGKHFEQYVFRMRRCVMTVVLDELGERLLLIWRHRFIVDQWDWEVPGGYVDPGEDGA